MTFDLLRRHRVAIFWITLVFVYGAAIWPHGGPDMGAGDKVNHIAAFLVLTLLGRFAYLDRRVCKLVAGLSAFGALIEITQAIPVLQRDASVWDWIADSAAILVALAVLWPFEGRVRSFIG